MRQSPAVRVQGHGGALWRAINLVLPALAVGGLGLWGALHLGVAELWAWVLASKLAAVTAATVAASPGWRGQQAHELVWDGQQWFVDGQGCQLRLMLDLGPWMLLSLRPDGAVNGNAAADQRLQATARPTRKAAPAWLPLAASEAGPAWGPLRAAVYAHPGVARPGRRTPEQQTP